MMLYCAYMGQHKNGIKFLGHFAQFSTLYGCIWIFKDTQTCIVELKTKYTVKKWKIFSLSCQLSFLTRETERDKTDQCLAGVILTFLIQTG